MTGQTRRKSIHIGGFKHANPIPNACRIASICGFVNCNLFHPLLLAWVMAAMMLKKPWV